MSKEQRKLQKRKEREKEVKQKLLVKREATRSVVREERDDWRKEKRIKKLQKDLEHFDQIMDEQRLRDADDSTLSQIEKNIEILKVLEQEHHREMIQKKELNEDLEAEGCLTLEEKIQAAMQRTGGDMGLGGSADCKVTVNKVPRPPKDFAVVDVIKAPQNIVEDIKESDSEENS